LQLYTNLPPFNEQRKNDWLDNLAGEVCVRIVENEFCDADAKKSRLGLLNERKTFIFSQNGN